MDMGQTSVASCPTKLDGETYDSSAALSSCSSTTMSSAAMFPLNLACSWFLLSILRLSLLIHQNVNVLPLHYTGLRFHGGNRKAFMRYWIMVQEYDLSEQSTYRLLHFSRECSRINVLLVLSWREGWLCDAFGRHD